MEATVKKILFVVNNFFPKPLGAAFSALNLAKELRRRGVLASFVVDGTQRGWRSRQVGWDGFAVYSFGFARGGRLRRILGFLAFSWFAWRNRRVFDVVQLQGGRPVNIYAGWAFQSLAHTPAVLKVTSDGWDSPDGIQKHKRGGVVWWFCRKLTGLVVMTREQEKKSRAAGWTKALCTIPNGVDVERYRPVEDEERSRLRGAEGLSDKDIVLLFSGILDYSKGIDVAMQVWDKLRQRFPQVVLLCAGDYGNTSREELALRLKEYSLPSPWAYSERLRLVGLTDRMHEYMQMADFFLFPSRQEGFGTVQIEAMASGLPCVANYLGGITEDIIPDSSVGCVIKQNQVDRFVDSIADMVGDETKRRQLGASARDYVCKRFGLRDTGRQYLAFYQSLNRGARKTRRECS